eukprot:7322608-Pyramimonas_sp.AAC.1
MLRVTPIGPETTYSFYNEVNVGMLPGIERVGIRCHAYVTVPTVGLHFAITDYFSQAQFIPMAYLKANGSVHVQMSMLNSTRKAQIRSAITKMYKITKGVYKPVIDPADIWYDGDINSNRVIIINYGNYQPTHPIWTELPVNMQNHVMNLALFPQTNRATPLPNLPNRRRRRSPSPIRNIPEELDEELNALRRTRANVNAVFRQPRQNINAFIEQTYPNFRIAENTVKRVNSVANVAK